MQSFFKKKNSKFATTHTEWKKSKPKDKIVVCAPHGLLTILFVALCRTHVIQHRIHRIFVAAAAAVATSPLSLSVARSIAQPTIYKFIYQTKLCTLYNYARSIIPSLLDVGLGMLDAYKIGQQQHRQAQKKSKVIRIKKESQTQARTYHMNTMPLRYTQQWPGKNSLHSSCNRRRRHQHRPQTIIQILHFVLASFSSHHYTFFMYY